MGGWWGQYSFKCQPVDYTDNATANRVSGDSVQLGEEMQIVGKEDERTLNLTRVLQMKHSGRGLLLIYKYNKHLNSTKKPTCCIHSSKHLLHQYKDKMS